LFYADSLIGEIHDKLLKMGYPKKQINEKFTKDSDPIEDMGIGMKHKIEEWIKEYKNSSKSYRRDGKFIINDDMTIDVHGSVNLYEIDLEKLPDYIQFNKVSGQFWINNNRLKTLKGCPKIVGGNFWCCDNKLTSLKYAPESVGGIFGCYNNLKKFTKADVLRHCRVNGRIEANI
jgi:hypothetical protein